MPEAHSVCRSPIFEHEVDDKAQNYIAEVFEIGKEDWRQPTVDYLQVIHVKKLIFIYYKGTLYRMSFDNIFLREDIQAMKEAHSGICDAHQSGQKLHLRIKRLGYYWQRCQARRFHANLIHQPPQLLHPTVASWPFDAWGLDVIRPLTKSSDGHLYLVCN